MLNEKKIISMTKMAVFEATEGKKNIAIGNYFKSDYILWQLIKCFVGATISFGICLGIYALYDFEMLMQDIYKMDMLLFAQDLIKKYLVLVVTYLFFSYLYYMIKFEKVRGSLRAYYSSLNELIKLYKVERLDPKE
ncbi:MAG: hypothetical protein R3Y54_09320 [Eubacteriales bacterium]